MGAYWYRPVVNRVCVPGTETLKAVAIQGFTLFEAGALVGTRCGAGSLTWRTVAVAWWPVSAGADYRHARCVSTRQQPIYLLASLFALGFLVFGPQLLIGGRLLALYLKKRLALPMVLKALRLPDW